MFVSLFAVEACLSQEDRYKVYNSLFDNIEAIEYALVSGFYYESKKDQETVSEAGDIVSYQTIDHGPRPGGNNFTESRVYIHTPSKMFGNDVVEVWKILERK